MPVAAIDIGANAIRLSIYSDNTICAPEIHTQKLKNTITSLLELDEMETALHPAYLSMRYLVDTCNNFKVSQIRCVATAILRDHPKSQTFVDIIKKKFGLDIEVLSGMQEATLTATGLIGGVVNPNGIAADLGGGSLELAEVSDTGIGKIESIDIGTRTISDNKIEDVAVITDIITKHFPGQKYKNLYLIGGGFRCIGKDFMEYHKLALRNLHNLEIDRITFSGFMEKMSAMHKNAYNTAGKIQYNTALVAKSLINIFNFGKIVISNYGLKEGIRFSMLPQKEREKNIISEKVKYLARCPEPLSSLNQVVEIIHDLLIKPDSELIDAIKISLLMCRCADNMHIDRFLRGDFIADMVLTSDIPFTLRSRAMVSMILAVIYRAHPRHRAFKIASKILGSIDLENVNIIAHFINIVLLTSGSANPVANFSLDTRDNGFIEIKTGEMLPGAIFAEIKRHIKEIGISNKSALRIKGSSKNSD